MVEDSESQSAYGATIIDNPLALISLEQLYSIVKEFHERTELKDVVEMEVLFRGAQLARDSDHYPSSLTPSEENAILHEKKERNARWFQPPEGLSVTIMAAAFAAITQGWQQSSINASQLFGWQEDLGVNADQQYLIGALNAAPWISGSLIGAWVSDPLQETFLGRRPALFIAAIFCVACVIGSKASIAPVFAAEAAPDRYRGRVLMIWQLFDAFGIFLGFVSSMIVRDNWRVLLATAIIPAVVLLCVVYICPESPRFLIRQGRYPEAYRSLRRLRRSDIQAARDLFSIHAQLQAETKALWNKGEEREWYEENIYQNWIKKTRVWERMGYLAVKPRVRRACMVASLVMATQQLCGINVLAFYSSDLFNISDNNNDNSELQQDNSKVQWYNFGFGLSMFLFTLIAYRYIDTRGRRFLLLISLGGMTVSLVLVSALFYVADSGVRQVLVSVFSIVVFTFFYSLGAGPIPFTLSPEVFPLCVREVGMSFSVMVNFLGLGLLVLFVPRLTEIFGRGKRCGGNIYGGKPQDDNTSCDGQANLLFFFSGLNVLAFILVFLLVPETNKVELERMNILFEKSTKRNIADNIRSLHTKPGTK
ncbi:hypothetical protein N7457_001476 [Penicillium paradoxum]|uniref:uncharacterized protein n=1 Tax=Penicillium paradoxum TaxID=176176 RepID=UPI00254985B1|nr:uncharacterized protein N7457_001476 [Penicillium paradoxum]KAJ5794877.1 hypothetical protein N7457_001476 [Penicillium paradoxum]